MDGHSATSRTAYLTNPTVTDRLLVHRQPQPVGVKVVVEDDRHPTSAVLMFDDPAALQLLIKNLAAAEADLRAQQSDDRTAA